MNTFVGAKQCNFMSNKELPSVFAEFFYVWGIKAWVAPIFGTRRWTADRQSSWSGTLIPPRLTLRSSNPRLYALPSMTHPSTTFSTCLSTYSRALPQAASFIRKGNRVLMYAARARAGAGEATRFSSHKPPHQDTTHASSCTFCPALKSCLPTMYLACFPNRSCDADLDRLGRKAGLLGIIVLMNAPTRFSPASQEGPTPLRSSLP